MSQTASQPRPAATNTEVDAAKCAAATDTRIVTGKAGLELRTLDDYRRFAQWVEHSGLQPKGMTVAQMVIAIEIGANLGLKPLQAIQSIAVINGRPSLWGDGLRALIVSHPLCEDIHEWQEGEGDQLAAVCEIKRRGRETPIVQRFSMYDAKRAGLAGKQGPWSQYPQRMLQWRAFSWAARDAFPDALRGVQIAEEMLDAVMTSFDVPGTVRRLREPQPKAQPGGAQADGWTPPPEFDASAADHSPDAGNMVPAPTPLSDEEKAALSERDRAEAAAQNDFALGNDPAPPKGGRRTPSHAR